MEYSSWQYAHCTGCDGGAAEAMDGILFRKYFGAILENRNIILDEISYSAYKAPIMISFSKAHLSSSPRVRALLNPSLFH